MFNCLRMDFYRMVHNKTTWIFVAIIVAGAALMSGMMWYVQSDAFATLAYMAPSASSGVSIGVSSQDAVDVNSFISSLTGESVLSYFGATFVAGGALSLLSMLFVALLLSTEFDSGFAKNIFSAQIGRGAFFASKMVVLLTVAIVFCAVSFAMLFAGSIAAGLSFQPIAFTDFLAWFALVTLTVFAFETIAALAVWLTRSKVASILVAVFVGGSVVYQLIGFVSMFVPALKSVPDFLLTGCMQSLGKAVDVFGPLGAGHIAGVAIAFAVVCAAGGLVALKKKDI